MDAELENSNSHISCNYRQHLNSKVLNCRSHTIHVFFFFDLCLFLCLHRLCGTKKNQSKHDVSKSAGKKKSRQVKRNSNKHMLKDMAHETKPHRKLNNNKSVIETTSIEFMQWNENETKQHTNSQSQLKIGIKPFAQYVCMSVGFANRRRRLHRRCCCYCRHAFAHTHAKIQMNLHIICERCYFTWSISRAMTHLTYFFLSLRSIFLCACAAFRSSLLTFNIMHGSNLFATTQQHIFFVSMLWSFRFILRSVVPLIHGIFLLRAVAADCSFAHVVCL